MPKDLRYFMSLMAKQAPGELARVEREVDPVFELPAVVRRFQEDGQYPAVLFQRVRGTSLRVISNLVGNSEKLALALETPLDRLTETYAAREEQRIPPRIVDSGPVHDVVLTGDQVDLARVPIVTTCEKDSGPFITGGVTIVRDPKTGKRNSGIYRMMVHARDRLGLAYEKHAHLTHLHRQAEAEGRDLECVTFAGHHPCYVLGCQSKVPLGVDEIEVMGALLQEPVDLVKCKTVDLEVPAWAEVAIEGRLVCGAREPEAPFGEYTWYYGLERNSPVVQVTAITHRSDAIYHHLFAAHPEHNLTGRLGRESVLLKRVKATVPTVKRVHLPMSGVCRFTAYVQIAKEYDGEGKLAALAALASDPFVKLAIVVDEDVNIYNDSEILWAIATRTQADRATFFVADAAVSRLDPASYSIWNRWEKDSMNTKWAIDATRPVEAPFEERADVPRELWERLNLADYVKREA